MRNISFSFYKAIKTVHKNANNTTIYAYEHMNINKCNERLQLQIGQ